MASTYTTGFGIEKIGTGEQAGAWGTTTNHNADILDRIASYTAVALSGATHTLTVREASPGSGTENLQDGMYRVIKFTGALGANNTVTIAPNTSPAWFIIENATTDSGSGGPYSVILTQGSGANVTVQNGKNAIIYCDGAGAGAVVYDALADLQVGTLEVTGAAAIDGALTAAAISATTLTTSGIASIDDTTDTTSGTTGSIHTDGGLGVAKNLFVATNATVSGTTLMTGVTTHGGNVVSDTDSTDDLGTTGVRWANLFVDGITATDQITATGFTGTLDGILGSGTPAAATVTTLTASGVTTVQAGTALLPSIVPTGDTNTGVWFPAADTVAASTAGAERMRITSAGNVGIGTASPGALLQIEGGTSADAFRIGLIASDQYYKIGREGATGILQFSGQQQTYSGYDFEIYPTGGSVGTSALKIAAHTGNVGIGTSAPTNKLDVVGDGARSVARASSTAGQSFLEAQASDYWSGPTYISTSLRQYGSTATGTTAGLSNASLGSLSFQNGSAGLIYTNGGIPIVFATTSIERMRITSAGNVGIGTTSPSSTLDIVDSVTNPIQIKFDSNASAASGRLGVGSTGNAIAVFDDNTVLESRTGGLALGIDNNNPILFYNTSSRIERMRIDSSGRLITGNNASISVLSVEAGFQNYAGSGYMTAGKFAADAFAPFYSFVKSRNATVGAHTIVQNGDDLGTIAFTGSDGTNFIRGAQIRAQVDGTPGTNDMPGRLTFFTTGDGASSPSERMRITAAGFVGIGTSSPDLALAVSGSIGSTGSLFLRGQSTGDQVIRLGSGRSGNGNSYIDLVGDTTHSIYGLRIIRTNGGENATSIIEQRGTGNLVISTNEAAAISFDTTGAERMRIDSAGNVGIGTASPSAKLHIDDNAASGTGLLVTGGGAGLPLATFTRDIGTTGTVTIGASGGDPQIQFESAGNTFSIGTDSTDFKISDNTAIGTNDRFTIDSTGNVGIGVSPSYKLHVDGDIYATGNITAYSAAAAKADIVTIANPLDLVSKLRGVSFRWKDSGKLAQGLIYEEVAEVIPEVTSNHGGAVGIQYQNLVAVLIESVKALKAEIDELKARY